ncbi:hypothetical protein SISNIDRAFT_491852 [Sistotremastrum niveocremeum HHB9708]|uniref:Uncharacterized protein n=1 Tax=Sistotremastrum niveocremeum HHB9708 TaxID=1314777 RepID=A0A164MBQ3_9AGAM|nr:hypothetical protein SISNIDRAFT_491852 [Sistotremastrum niveocremeum HHB9708]
MAINSHTLGASRELVLALCKADVCEYYLVDHSQQLIYWIEPTDTPSLGLPGVSSLSHLRLLLRQQYYIHLELFCMHVGVTRFVQDRLMSTLAFYCIDGTTARSSTSPYTPGDCQVFLRILEMIPVNNAAIGYKTWIVARLLSEIYGSYFLHFRGEPSPRLARSQRRSAETTIDMTRWFRVMNTALWHVPSKHYQNLRDQWVNKLCYKNHWHRCLQQLSSEWSSSVCYAAGTILFNVSLLHHNNIEQRYLGALAHFISSAATISGLFSIGSGVLLSRLLPTMGSVESVGNIGVAGRSGFLEAVFQTDIGFQPVSVVFAIPWAAFMWSASCVALHAIILCLHGPSFMATIPVVAVLGSIFWISFRLWFILQKAVDRLLSGDRRDM